MSWPSTCGRRPDEASIAEGCRHPEGWTLRAQAVVAHAGWIIDLGPGAGHDGGRIAFEGTPTDLDTVCAIPTAGRLAA